MNALTVKELYTLEETIAKDLFDKVTYPWEVLPNIGSFIKELGNTLSSEWSGDHRERSGSASLCVYKRKRDRGRRSSRRKFDRA